MEERVENLKFDPNVLRIERARDRLRRKWRQEERENAAVISDGFKGLLKNKPRDLTPERVLSFRVWLRAMLYDLSIWEKNCRMALTIKNDKWDRAYALCNISAFSSNLERLHSFWEKTFYNAKGFGQCQQKRVVNKHP